MEIPEDWNEKIISDPVNGIIEIDDYALRVIDTEEFQRLRSIKQLGFVYQVFPGASHNRFEHSVGTYHLAGTLVKHLKRIQPELGISEREIKCVKLAGLCHDLGHGPFSHFFADYVRRERPHLEWEHEKASEEILEHMVKKYKEIYIDPEELNFIKDLIHGVPRSDYPESKKRYLFEIVANKRNSIDVDKLDYIQRDCYNVGIKYSVDAMRLIRLTRVIDNQICFNSKEAFNIYQSAYTHRVSQSIELMISDALHFANEKFEISDSVLDMEKFKLLTDSILERIVTDGTRTESCKIIKRVHRRDLYRFVNQLILPPSEKVNAIKFFDAKNIISFKPSGMELPSDVVCVVWKKLDFTMAEINPLSVIRFYNKGDVTVAFELTPARMSLLLPEVFEEVSLRVFVKQEKYEKTAQVALKAAFLKYKQVYPKSGVQLLS